MNHKPRPYRGYALVDRACGWAAATMFAVTIIACIAAVVTDARQDATPCETVAAEAIAETERPLLPVEYISLTVETEPTAEPEPRSYNSITEGDVIVSELTYYDVCKHCCGKTDGVTASGLVIANGTEPETPVARGSCHGLAIELKRTKGGRVSAEQRWWINRLLEQGYCAAVCNGWQAAKRVIEDYLRGGIVMRARLKAARKAKGLTAQQVADMLYITLRHYQRLEKGETMGSFSYWDALEDFLGIHQRILREISSEPIVRTPQKATKLTEEEKYRRKLVRAWLSVRIECRVRRCGRAEKPCRA